MNKKIIPLSVPNLSLDIMKNIEETIRTGWVSTGGRFITEFEEKVAAYTGAKRAVALQSGTAGLHLALEALGVSAGDEVIVPTLTFIAAVNPVRYVGAEPIFMDCDDTLNMDMDKLEEFLLNNCSLESGIVTNRKTGKTIKGIIIVHVFGNPADMERLLKIKELYGLFILEDATEAMGSFIQLEDGRSVHCGTLGDIGIFSFNANKIVTSGGGGMAVSQDDSLLDRMQFLGIQAKNDSLYFIHDEVGYNYRMSNIHAAYGTDQMDYLEAFVMTKIRNYKTYKEAIDGIPGLSLMGFNENARANHWFYSVCVDKEGYGESRDELLNRLIENGIQARPVWALIHEQKTYLKNEAYHIEKACHYRDVILNIPCSTSLNDEEIRVVVDALRSPKK